MGFFKTMNFASWILSEEIALLQHLRPNNQIVALGRIGLWDVYSAMPYPKWFNGTKTPIMSLNRYLKSAQQRPVPPQFAAMYGGGPTADRIEDKVADNVPMVKQMLENAAYRLSALGFRKHSTTLVFMDMGGKVNHITGGGVGGEAWNQKHGCTVDRTFATSPYGEDIVVHEHAHMYWNEVLPARAKTAFYGWWLNNVHQWNPDEKSLAQSKAEKMRPSIGTEQGAELRRAITKAGIVPSAYAASDEQELWAVVVDYASKNLNSVPKELKDLLLDILSGTEQSTHLAWHRQRKPRKMERRKNKRGK